VVVGLDVPEGFCTESALIFELQAALASYSQFIITASTDPHGDGLAPGCLHVSQEHIRVTFWAFHLISPPFLFFLNGETGERREDLYAEEAASDGGERRPSMRHAGRAGLWRAGISLM